METQHIELKRFYNGNCVCEVFLYVNECMNFVRVALRVYEKQEMFLCFTRCIWCDCANVLISVFLMCLLPFPGVCQGEDGPRDGKASHVEHGADQGASEERVEGLCVFSSCCFFFLAMFVFVCICVSKCVCICMSKRVCVCVSLLSFCVHREVFEEAQGEKKKIRG